MKGLVAWTPPSHASSVVQVFAVKRSYLKGQVGWKSTPRHRVASALGRGVLSNSHRGAMAATQRSRIRKDFVPTGLRSSRKRGSG